MANIKINNKIKGHGKVTIIREKEYIDSTEIIKITGILSTHYYIEEIEEIETERYKIKGIEVTREEFGSDSYEILYYFEAQNIMVKGKEIIKGVSILLKEEEIEEIENKLLKEEDKILGDIEDKYKIERR